MNSSLAIQREAGRAGNASASTQATSAPTQTAADWTQPWLAPFSQWRDAAEAPDWRELLTRAARCNGVVTASGCAVSFVAANDAPTGVAYETHIAATGRVPSRDNWHDRFNALMWIAWPRTKAALNARQAAEIARDGIQGRRGAVRDAATLIDESALLVACDDAAVFERLMRRDWRALLIEQRTCWGRDIVPCVFGHALLEKLTGPYKAITAAVVPVPRGDGTLAVIDAAAARFAGRSDLAPPLLAHLPVLGIPGWWPDNASPAFYDDARVFRAPAAEPAREA